jgi:hypothetical protein
MQISINSESKTIWSARVIGWVTLFFGIESGFIVASVNWFRMGYKTKAFIHIAIAILIASVNTLFLQDYLRLSSHLSIKDYSIRLLISFGLIFLAIAYLHSTTRKDIELLQENGKSIKNWNWFFAVLIGLIFFISLDFLDKAFFAYRLYSLQNHVYCDVLQSGMTFKEVATALNGVGKNTLINADFLINTDDIKVKPEQEPAHFWTVFFDTQDEKIQTALSGKGFGFDSSNKLIWVSTFNPIEIIQCP